MQEVYALGFLAGIVAPVVAVGLYMIKTLMELKQDVAVLKEQTKFYHPKKK